MRCAVGRVTLLILGLSALACDSEPAALFVDVKTDLVPGREFMRIVIDPNPEEEGDEIFTTALAGEDWISGIRVLEQQGIAEGAIAFDVRAESSPGVSAISRRVRLNLEGRRAITILLTRDCAAAHCDDGELQACLNGTCVDAGCFEENPSLCGSPVCSANLDCDTGSACGMPVCDQGYCLAGIDASLCASDQVCDAVLGCAGRSQGTAPTVLWSMGFATNGGEARAVAIDAVGDIFIGGGVNAPGSVGGAELLGGDREPFVASYDSGGAHRWSRSFPGEGGGEYYANHASGIALGPGGDVFVTGVTTGLTDLGAGPVGPGGEGQDFGFVASLTSTGDPRWGEVFGTDGSRALGRDIFVNAAGRAFVTGHHWKGQIIIGGDSYTPVDGSHDLLFFAIDEVAGSPSYVFTRSFGATKPDEGWAFGEDLSGDIRFTGGLPGDQDLGAGAFGGNYGTQVFQARFDADGTDLGGWSTAEAEGSSAQGQALIYDAAGNAYIAGVSWEYQNLIGEAYDSQGNPDAFLLSVAPDGSVRWVNRWGQRDSDAAYGLAFDMAGNIWVVGEFQNVVDFGGGPVFAMPGGCDVYVAAFDTMGGHVFSMALGGNDSDIAYDIAAAPDGSMVVVGAHGDQADLGNGPLDGYGPFLVNLCAGCAS